MNTLPSTIRCGGGDNRDEVTRLETGTPDQRAIDVRDRKNLRRVRSLDGAAIEDANLPPCLTVALLETGADHRMHLADLGDCRNLSRADRPDRFIGNRQSRGAGLVRQ